MSDPTPLRKRRLTKRQRNQRRRILTANDLPEKCIHIPAWDERGPDGQVIPCFVVIRRLTVAEMGTVQTSATVPAPTPENPQRERYDYGIAMCLATILSLREAIPDSADPENPLLMRGGDLLLTLEDMSFLRGKNGAMFQAIASWAMQRVSMDAASSIDVGSVS